MRSEYIWFIQKLADDVVACFTVKHEMVTWVRPRSEYHGGIYRIKDGGAAAAVWVDPGTLDLS